VAGCLVAAIFLTAIYQPDSSKLEARPMSETSDSAVQKVIDWWKEYGFKRGECEHADTDPLFRELLERINELSCEGQLKVFEWIDEN
jgi:hypothetical protein